MAAGIRCKNCGDVIFSESRYDHKECSCGNVAIWDGPRFPTIRWPGDKTAEESFEWEGLWPGRDMTWHSEGGSNE